MDRLKKETLVQELQNELKGASSIVVSHYTGLTVGEITQLRKKIREAGAKTVVIKNRLAKIAFAGTQFEGLCNIMTGQTILAFSEDAIAAAKVTHSFAKENKALEIIGGALNSEVLNVEGVKALAMMPSLDELRAKLIGTISAPAQRLAQYTQEPASKLARVCNARGEQAA